MNEAPDRLRVQVDLLLGMVGGVPGELEGLTLAPDADVIAMLGQAQVVSRIAEAIAAAAAGEVAR